MLTLTINLNDQGLIQWYIIHCFPFQGAIELIYHFHAQGIPMALATGSETYEFDLKTSKHNNVF